GALAHLGTELDEPELHALAAQDVGVGGIAPDLRQLAVRQGVDAPWQRCQAALADGGGERRTVAGAQRLGDRAVGPLGLAGPLRELYLELAQLLDLAVGEVERGDELLLADLL